MSSYGRSSVVLAVAIPCFVLLPRPAAAQELTDLPSPLGLSDVIRLAAEGRAEIQAARAGVRAGEARPTLAASLEDPMISPSLDHLPFMMGGADASVTIEQRVPLSAVRRHRRDAALADLERLRAEGRRTGLDVAGEAAIAFLMLQERRRTMTLLDGQLAVARDVVTAANARYAGGTGPQADVLRAEVEVARLDATTRAIRAESLAAEAMLNAALGRESRLPVPELRPPVVAPAEPDWDGVAARVAERPELAAARAEITRAAADVRVMRAMSRPMATIRTGPAYTMAEGRGWMAMVGISVPIWRDKVRAGVAEAEAMQAMVEADAHAMTRMFDGQAAVAFYELRAARERQRALAGDVLPRARMAVEPAVAAYAAGRLPLVSVLEAVQALWLVESELIAAETELASAWVRLGRATGSYEALIP